MTDRELLELAAKAAGYIVQQHVVYGEHAPGAWVYEAGSALDRYGEPRIFLWRPRDDDGDALRLAVKLRLHLEWWPGLGKVAACTAEKQTAEPYEDDPNAATRRAIVSAAAEIGKGLRPFPSAEEIREEWT